MVSVLVLGGTGYIGAPLLTALRKKYPNFKITAYIRSRNSDSDFSKLNIEVVHGTFEGLEMLKSLASKHDIVINAADSHNTDLTNALVTGLKAGTGSKGVLIHVSGAGNFFDGGSSGDLNPDSKVWNDASVEDISETNDKMLNGACDKIILEAGAAGDIVDFIVAPGGVHGQARTEIAKGTRGFFIDHMLENCKKLGYSPYIGSGTAIFHLSEVNDTVSLLMLVFDQAIKGTAPTEAYRRFYIVGGVEKTWKEIATIFAETLYHKEMIQEATARQVTPDNAGAMAGFLGGSILVKYDNATSLGYQPQGFDIAETLVHSI